jgi:4-hydroxy-tetrahydrodipicolinate synthase
MFDPQKLHGVIPPVASPLHPDGRLDAESLKQLCNFLIDGGVHGLFALGSTSEFAALTDDERATSMQVAVQTSAGRVPVLAGIMETSTARVVQQGLRAKAAGIDAVVLAAPYYHSHSQAELITHFRTVKREVGLPIMAYDIPVMVKIKLEPRTVITLATEGTVIGLKDSSGNWEQFREVIMGTRHIPTFKIFTGSELLVDMALFMGAHGVVPGVGNVVPRDYARLYDLVKQGQWAEAQQLQDQLITFFKKLIGQGPAHGSSSASALGGFKAGLKALGVIAHTTTAPPMSSFTAAEEEKICGVMREFGYIR